MESIRLGPHHSLTTSIPNSPPSKVSRIYPIYLKPLPAGLINLSPCLTAIQ